MTLSSLSASTRHRVGRLTTLLLAGGLVLATAPAASADETLSTQFETGSMQAWTDTSGVVLGSEYAFSGRYGAHAVSTPLAGGFLKWGAPDLDTGMQYARIRGWVRIDSVAPDEPVGVMTVKNNAGEHHFDILRDARTGKWRWDLFRQDNAYSTMDAELDTWYYIEAIVDFGGDTGTTYSAQVQINGIDQPSIESVDEVGATVRAGWFGGPQVGQTNSRDYDGLVMDVADTPFQLSR